MEHREFLNNSNLSIEDFEIEVINAIEALAIENRIKVDDITLAQKEINQNFNGSKGVFTKFRIVKESVIIGFLECFKSNDNALNIIYTSPTNSNVS